MAEQSLKDKTAKGLFWGGVSNGVQQLLGMLFGIYLARTLNAEDYGLVGMLAIFSGIASTIINSGFSVALTNKLDATHKDYNAVFWFSFVVSICLYIVLFFSAPLIASFYDRQELVNLSRVIFASFCFLEWRLFLMLSYLSNYKSRCRRRLMFLRCSCRVCAGFFWHSMVSLIGHWQFKVRCMWQVHLC